MNADSASLPPVPASASSSFSSWLAPGIVALVVLFDVCFYGQKLFFGLSLALFFAGVVVMIRLNRTPVQMGRRGGWLLALAAGCVAETVIETGVCNGLLLVVLTAALAGETWFVGRLPGLDRWSAQVRAFILAPFRAARVALLLVGGQLLRRGLAGRVGAWVVIAVPTLVLLLVFGGMLSGANAVFSLWMGQAFNWVWNFVPDIGPLRIVLWMVAAVGAVAVLSPSEAPDRSWNWQARFARWSDLVPAPLALTTSAVMLAALNALFAVANGADAVFLWHGGALPAGVNYATFVHEGVEMLITTVLLSALVLASVFNQSTTVAGRRGLKILGGLWIAQNLFLVLSTARRLELYIEAYGASVERFSTLIFLLLVTAGFGLLAVMIVREKPLAWLVGRSALAAFATVYLAQFLNLAGWVAEYNVARWEADRTRNLDACYLELLGPAAWPALARAVSEGANGTSELESARLTEKRQPSARLDAENWRSFSLRAWWNRKALGE